MGASPCKEKGRQSFCSDRGQECTLEKNALARCDKDAMVRQNVAHDVHGWMMSSFATVRCDMR